MMGNTAVGASIATPLLMYPLAVLGALCVLYAVYLAWVSKYRIERFEPVEAEILRSHVRREAHLRGELVTPTIEYEYTVDGERYTSENVYPSPVQGSGNDGKHEWLVETYSVGSTTDAYYDPGDPSRAFLHRDVPISSILSVLLIAAVTGPFGWYYVVDSLVL